MDKGWNSKPPIQKTLKKNIGSYQRNKHIKEIALEFYYKCSQPIQGCMLVNLINCLKIHNFAHSKNLVCGTKIFKNEKEREMHIKRT